MIKKGEKYGKKKRERRKQMRKIYDILAVEIKQKAKRKRRNEK